MPTYSWIHTELKRIYPKANLAKGVDLNKNGKLEANEKITDANRNKKIGDPADWQAFLKRNAATMRKIPGIFKQGTFLKSDNPIHDILSAERPLAKLQDVRKVYKVIKGALAKLKKNIAAQKKPAKRTVTYRQINPYVYIKTIYRSRRQSISRPLDKGNAIYKAIRGMGMKFSNSTNGSLLTQNIRTGILDCDTGSYLALAIAHEMGWPIHFVGLPGIPISHVFLRWDDGKRTKANIDHMGSKPNSYYIKRYRIHPDTVKRSTALKNHTRDQLIAWVLGVLTGEQLKAKKMQPALKSAQLAFKLNPKGSTVTYWLAGVHHLMRNATKAIPLFTKAIHLNPWNARAYYARSNAYSNKGEAAKAARDLATAKLIDPSIASRSKFLRTTP